MANADTPQGAVPINHGSSGYGNRLTEYAIASGYATSIFLGDFVKLVAGGGIEAAAATNRVLGVFAGVQYTDSTGNIVFSKYWPASTTATNIKAMVYDDPNQLFSIQSSGSTVAADVGNLGDIVAGAGSTATGRSAHEINGTTGTGIATLQIKGKVETPGNDWGTNVNLIVRIYEHEHNSHAAAGTPGV